MRTAACVVALALPMSARADQSGFYSLTQYELAMGVSDNGTVLMAKNNGYVWTVQGGGVPLQASFGVQRISANGRVVIGRGSGGGFRYDIPSGEYELLPIVPNWYNSTPMGISADGQRIAGWEENLQRGWLWSAGAGTQAAGPSAPTRVYDLSRDGLRMTGSNGPSPFIHTIGGPTQTLPVYGNYQRTDMRRFSADGSVVVGGAYSIIGAERLGEALRWTDGGGYQSLGSIGPLPGHYQDYLALASNANGTLIGGTQGYRRAWIWDAQHGMRDLRSVLINDFGYDLTNWTLEQVTDISPDGRYIVGGGGYFNGIGTQAAAFVVVIPSPPSGLALLGLLVLKRRRR
jgi:hypothetical protein